MENRWNTGEKPTEIYEKKKPDGTPMEKWKTYGAPMQIRWKTDGTHMETMQKDGTPMDHRRETHGKPLKPNGILMENRQNIDGKYKENRWKR